MTVTLNLKPGIEAGLLSQAQAAGVTLEEFDAHHSPSAKALRAGRENSFCGLRTLGEVYAVLTGLPVRPRIAGSEGMAILEQILEKADGSIAY